MDLAELYQRRVVYELPEMDRVAVRKDATYKHVDSLDLRMDLYSPPEQDARHPAVILIAGDAWPETIKDSKEWGVFVSRGQLIAASGMAAITFNHRSTASLTRLADVAGDIDDLVAFVRTHAETFGIDGDRLALWAFSAGPPFGFHTALLEAPRYVRCLVSYYGILDLQHEREHIRPEVSDEILRDHSAIHHLTTRSESWPPFFIARAGRDMPHFNDSVDPFVMLAMEKNISLDLMTHPSGQHGFDTLDDDARSRQIIRGTLSFLQEHLLSSV